MLYIAGEPPLLKYDSCNLYARYLPERGCLFDPWEGDRDIVQVLLAAASLAKTTKV